MFALKLPAEECAAVAPDQRLTGGKPRISRPRFVRWPRIPVVQDGAVPLNCLREGAHAGRLPPQGRDESAAAKSGCFLYDPSLALPLR